MQNHVYKKTSASPTTTQDQRKRGDGLGLASGLMMMKLVKLEVKSE